MHMQLKFLEWAIKLIVPFVEGLSSKLLWNIIVWISNHGKGWWSLLCWGENVIPLPQCNVDLSHDVRSCQISYHYLMGMGKDDENGYICFLLSHAIFQSHLSIEIVVINCIRCSNHLYLMNDCADISQK